MALLNWIMAADVSYKIVLSGLLSLLLLLFRLNVIFCTDDNNNYLNITVDINLLIF